MNQIQLYLYIFVCFLDKIEYQANRIPLDGVPLDVSGEDLVGCDCTDGCRDRTKCACWLKTFEVRESTGTCLTCFMHLFTILYLQATEFTSYPDDKNRSNTNIGYRGKLRGVLTIKTDLLSNNFSIPFLGRRLPEIVPTGIFECNSKCKCDCRCSNRVAQNGISVRLQLFKTHRKVCKFEPFLFNKELNSEQHLKSKLAVLTF